MHSSELLCLGSFARKMPSTILTLNYTIVMLEKVHIGYPRAPWKRCLQVPLGTPHPYSTCLPPPTPNSPPPGALLALPHPLHSYEFFKVRRFSRTCFGGRGGGQYVISPKSICRKISFRKDHLHTSGKMKGGRWVYERSELKWEEKSEVSYKVPASSKELVWVLYSASYT